MKMSDISASSLSANECKTPADVRQQIDRVDRALVALLAERWTYVDRIWHLKDNPEEAIVPWRIEEVIQRVRKHAEEGNLPPDFAEAVWRCIIQQGIEYEEEKIRLRNAQQ